MNAPADDRDEYERPRTRGDCLPGGCNAARPCPWVSCRHHLALEPGKAPGTLKLARPEVAEGDLTGLAQTCSLDVSDGLPLILDAVGPLLGGITRERVRQIETKALSAFKRATPRLAPDLLPDVPVSSKPRPGAAQRSLAGAVVRWARTQREPWRTSEMAQALSLPPIQANNLAGNLYRAGRLTRVHGPDGRWTYSIPSPTQKEAA